MIIVTPEVSWIAIAPDLILALGAAAVLLVEVQWKPPVRILGYVTAASLVVAVGFSVLQWILAGDAIAAGNDVTLLAFSNMVTMDGLAVFARLALLPPPGSACSPGGALSKVSVVAAPRASPWCCWRPPAFRSWSPRTIW